MDSRRIEAYEPDIFQKKDLQVQDEMSLSGDGSIEASEVTFIDKNPIINGTSGIPLGDGSYLHVGQVPLEEDYALPSELEYKPTARIEMIGSNEINNSYLEE